MSGSLIQAAHHGPVVAVKRIWDPELIRQETGHYGHGRGHLGDQEALGSARVYVDHAGPNRRLALELYQVALIEEGFTVEKAKLRAGGKKEFLWVRRKDGTTTA